MTRTERAIKHIEKARDWFKTNPTVVNPLNLIEFIDPKTGRVVPTKSTVEAKEFKIHHKKAKICGACLLGAFDIVTHFKREDFSNKIVSEAEDALFESMYELYPHDRATTISRHGVDALISIYNHAIRRLEQKA